MKDIALRIKELIDYLGLSNKSFAESIAIAPAIISHVLSGRNNPSLHLVQQITNVYTNVNLTYLLSGEGDLIVNDSASINHPLNNPEKASHSSSPVSSLPPGARYVSPPSGAPIPHSAATEISTKLPEKEAELFDPPEEPTKKAQDKKHIEGKKTASTSGYELEGKEIERIVVFYKDRSFREYQPEG